MMKKTCPVCEKKISANFMVYTPHLHKCVKKLKLERDEWQELCYSLLDKWRGQVNLIEDLKRRLSRENTK